MRVRVVFDAIEARFSVQQLVHYKDIANSREWSGWVTESYHDSVEGACSVMADMTANVYIQLAEYNDED